MARHAQSLPKYVCQTTLRQLLLSFRGKLRKELGQLEKKLDRLPQAVTLVDGRWSWPVCLICGAIRSTCQAPCIPRQVKHESLLEADCSAM